MSFISISPLIIHIYTVSGSSLYSKHTLQNSASHWTETLRVIACGCLLAYSFNCTVDTKTTIVVSFNIDKTLFAISKDSGTSNVQYRQLVIHSFNFEVRYISWNSCILAII